MSRYDDETTVDSYNNPAFNRDDTTEDTTELLLGARDANLKRTNPSMIERGGSGHSRESSGRSSQYSNDSRTRSSRYRPSDISGTADSELGFEAAKQWIIFTIVLLIVIVCVMAILGFILSRAMWWMLALLTMLSVAMTAAFYHVNYVQCSRRERENVTVFLQAMGAAVPAGGLQLGAIMFLLWLVSGSNRLDRRHPYSPSTLAILAVTILITAWISVHVVYALVARRRQHFDSALEVTFYGLYCGLGYATVQNLIWILVAAITPSAVLAPTSEFVYQALRALLFVPLMAVVGMLIGSRVGLYTRGSLEPLSLPGIILPAYTLLFLYEYLPIVVYGHWAPWLVVLLIATLVVFVFVYLHSSVLSKLRTDYEEN